MSATRLLETPATDRAAADRRHLEARLRRLRLLLQARALWLRSQWRHDPRVDAAAGIISEAHAEWLLAGEDAGERRRFAATDARCAALLAEADAMLDTDGGMRAGSTDGTGPGRNGGVAADGRAGYAPPLEVLRRLYGLDETQCDALVLALAPEVDPSFGTLYAYLQDDVGLHHATARLLSVLDPAADPDAHAGGGVLGAAAPLVAHRLLQLDAAAAAQARVPLALAPLRLDRRMADYLLGVNRPDELLARHLRNTPAVAATTEQAALAARIAGDQAAHRASTGHWRPVVLHGAPGSGRSATARAACSALGLRVLELDPGWWPEDAARAGLLEREALLLRCAFLVHLPDDAGSPGAFLPDAFLPGTALPDAARLDGTRFPETSGFADHRTAGEAMVAASAAPTGQASFAGAPILMVAAEPLRLEPGPLTVALPPLSGPGRLELWRGELGPAAIGLDAELRTLVEQYPTDPAAIRHTAAAARQAADLAGEPLQGRHLFDAARASGAETLDALAERIETSATRRDLVLPAPARRQLDELADQVRHRYAVYEEWGMRPGRGRGISALFSGPSGTGKTLAAEVLANELQLGLHRVDLAGVVSKYIGETEKNLRRVFAAAQSAGAVLFFDEADALFGKRTDVKDSHDRYANIEVNYLLQQMEAYAGLSILATNRRTALDRAFLRRLRFVIDFPTPDATSRRRIWQGAFPAGVPREPLDLDRLAGLDITGGNIHNIAVAAAFLAAARGRAVGMDLILQAARAEFAKLDRPAGGPGFEEPRP